MVSYLRTKTYYWNSNVSCAGCSPTDEVTVPNLVLLVEFLSPL